MDNTSEFNIDRKECPHCGAVWLDGKHIWRGTGASSPNSEFDLASLVCNTPHGKTDQCINPKRGEEGGDTWAKREKDLAMYMKRLLDEQ